MTDIGKHVLIALSILFAWIQPATAQEFIWNQGQPPLTLPAVNTHWCVLTHVQGKMHRWGERVNLSVVKDRWQLTGSSLQEGVGGRANCFPLSTFKALGTTRMVSHSMARQWAGVYECARNPIRAWWGDAFTAITAFGGNQRGGGEFLEVLQSSGGKTDTWAMSHACADKQVFVAVMSYFIGTPESGRPARFFGPGGSNLTADKAGEYVVRNGGGTVLMAPVDQALCYFTYIGGAFNGGGEAARIFRQNGRWALRAESSSGQGVWTRARCFLFDQSK